MKKLITAGIAIALGGCITDSEFALPTGGAGRSFMDQWQGRSVPSRSAPAPAGQVPATGAAKMLQDPEAREESTEDYVWATDEAAARSACERTAERNGWRLDGVEEANDWRNNAGNKRFTCRWTMFVPRN